MAKFKINGKPSLSKKPLEDQAPPPSPTQMPSTTSERPQPVTAAQMTSTSKPDSSNRQYGIADVPESVKNQVRTPEQIKEALQKGELMYGPVPATPVMEAFKNVHFDFNDGFRLMVDKEAKEDYFIQLQDEQRGTVLFHGIVKADNYICTLQKFYIEFSVIVTKLVPLTEKQTAKLVERYNVAKEDVNFLYEMLRIPGSVKELCINEYINKRGDVENVENFADDLKEIADGYTFRHVFDPKDKEIMVQLPVGTIGDSIGWFAYMERFQKKTGCKLICVMNPGISKLFEKQYPDITFIGPVKTVDYKPYACYRLGLFFKGDTTNQPYDFRYIGNHRTASKILDVNDDDIAPRVDLSAPRKIKEPYVCIAAQASAYCKLWNNPAGWMDVVRQLKEIGYRVLCIDREPITGQGIATNQIPYGAEDFTGNRPLQERIDLLKDCDFFIGLSSGVSWLAWCAQCPVVMISGFTNPFNEFYTPYRVINTLFCHGCWNDERCDFDHYDYMWCPRHKGTERAYECSRTISSKYVMNVVKTIPAYQKRAHDHEMELLADKVNSFIVEQNENKKDGVVKMLTPVQVDRIVEMSNELSTEAIASEFRITEATVAYTMSMYRR